MPARWEEVAQRLESLASSPTDEQLRVAMALGITLDADLPAPVAAVVLRSHLEAALMESVGRDSEIPETLGMLEDQLGITDRAELRTGSSAEVSAWFASRYMLLTARGLRDLRPLVGDVVTRGDSPERMVISSIADNGRVYMKGGRGKFAWPNHLTVVARDGESEDHAAFVAEVDANIRNSRASYLPNSPRLDPLDEYRVKPIVPTTEAVRELEDLLESGERLEGPFQELLERQPQFLASLVVGNWATYVIPQQRLGSGYVTDFLVLGVNSLGPQWLAVEIEAPRHQLLRADGDLRQSVNHAVGQIQNWRQWLTENVAEAQDNFHLYGIQSQIRGLVIIGRGEPSLDRQSSRAIVGEQQAIDVHTWDWLLRQARHLLADGRRSAAIAMNATMKISAYIDEKTGANASEGATLR